jgi:hypothetical protein
VFSEGSFDPLDTESTVRHECVFLSHAWHWNDVRLGLRE